MGVARAADEPFLNLTCKMGACTWYRIENRMDIKQSETGRLVGATLAQCETHSKDGADYPTSYQCKPQEIRPLDYVANCSVVAPSVAFKDNNNKWQRTKLSLSEDAEFGYNRSAIDLYLRICHDYVRGRESLDMIGAKFGYSSRAKKIESADQDTVDTIADLATERRVAQSAPQPDRSNAPAPVEGFQTPSRNIFCQVFRFDRPYALRCDVMNLEGPVPPKPRDCRDTDWGQAFAVAENGAVGHRICYTDTVASETLETLPYGTTFRTKEFTCKSETNGVTCSNAGGHGFFVSRKTQSTF